MRRPRYQLCLAPCDTLQLTREGATGCLSPRRTLPLGVSCCPSATLLLLPCLGLSAGASTNFDIYLAALEASSLHFLLLPPFTPQRASVVPGHPAGSSLTPSPMLLVPACPEDLALVPRLSCCHGARKHKPGVNPSKLSLTRTPAPCLPRRGCIQSLLGFS